MKKLFSVILLLGICHFGSAQMTKSDVESILSGANVSSKEKIYVIFNRVYSGGQWVEKFDKFSAATAVITPKDGALKIKGNSYSYLFPYSSIKYITIESTFMKIELLH
jgi:hypothetical protein